MSRRPLIAAHRQLLDQALTLVEALDVEDFRSGVPAAQLASPGAHLRHVLDMIGCFLRGIESGAVDYEARARDTGVEQDPVVCRAALQFACAQLDELADVELPASLRIHGDTPVGMEGERVFAESTVERELQFLLNHGLHHFALIAAGLRLRGRALPADFGMAPSTLRWLADQKQRPDAREEAQACAR